MVSGRYSVSLHRDCNACHRCMYTRFTPQVKLAYHQPSMASGTRSMPCQTFTCGTGAAGFVFSLSKNSWGFVGASTNPWLGVDSDSLRASGGSCSSCIIEGDWWRVLSSLIVPAGLIHLFSITFLISASSSVCARAGLPPGELVACILAGGVIGSMTSAVAAPHTIHSTAGALGAAAVTAALASILSVRRHVITYGPVLMLAVLWLVALLVSSLAPFVDTWAALSGGLAGGLCAAAFMAPYAPKVRTLAPAARM